MSQSPGSGTSRLNHQTPTSTIESITSSLSDNKIHLLLAASGSVATIKLPLIVKTLSERYSQPGALPQQSQQQQHGGLSIRILLTPSATRFLAGQAAEQPPLSSLLDIPGVDGIHLDEDEWREPWKRGNAILHIELRRWADMLVVAPLSANTMAKIVNGFADGILASVVRAWDARGELDTDVVRGSGAEGSSTTATTGSSGEGSSAAAATTRPRRAKKKRIIVAPAMNTAMWRHPITAKQLRVLEDEWGVASPN
ncbi:flavo protein, partial [Microdochium bolleyi]